MRRSGLICLARSSRTGLDMSHILFIDRKSGSAGMPRPISYAVFCLKKKIADGQAQFPVVVHQHVAAVLTHPVIEVQLSFLILLRLLIFPLFPYTTLFRSLCDLSPSTNDSVKN